MGCNSTAKRHLVHLRLKEDDKRKNEKKVREEYKLYLYTFCKMALEAEVKTCITDHQTQ